MNHTIPTTTTKPAPEDEIIITDPGLWKKAGWIAKVIKNEDDDGWAVAMTRVGDSEPALVGPWTMGRDKRNPKPLDAGAFATLVKTASEVLLRHEQAARERLHKTLRTFTTDDGRRSAPTSTSSPDDDDPARHPRARRRGHRRAGRRRPGQPDLQADREHDPALPPHRNCALRASPETLSEWVAQRDGPARKDAKRRNIQRYFELCGRRERARPASKPPRTGFRTGS